MKKKKAGAVGRERGAVAGKEKRPGKEGYEKMKAANRLTAETTASKIKGDKPK